MPNPCEYIYESVTCSERAAPITSYSMSEYVDFVHTYPNVKSWGNMHESAGAAVTATPKIQARMSLAESISTTDEWGLRFRPPVMAESVAASDTPKYVPYYAMTEAVGAAGVMGPKVLAKRTIAEVVSATGLFSPYAYELLSETVAAADTFAATRHVSVTMSEAANLAGVFTPSIHVLRAIAETAGFTAALGHTATQGAAIAESVNVANSFWFRNADFIAWQMNTETTAVNWHTNYQFNSIAQFGNVVIAVEEDGVYVLSGSTDNGSEIASSVATGFMDFGDHRVKRLGSVYFGITGSPVSVSIEAANDSPGSGDFDAQSRTLVQPGNNRVIPGKGLNARYWRMTLTNIDGGDFDIKNIEFDVAISNKRRL